MATNLQSPEELLSLGVDYKREGNYEEAEKCYMKALHIDKSNPVGYYNLAKLYYLGKMQVPSLVNYLRCLHVSIASRWLDYRNGDTEEYNRICRSIDKVMTKAQSRSMYEKHKSTPFLYSYHAVIMHVGHTLMDLSEQNFSQRCNSLLEQRPLLNRDKTRTALLELRRDYRTRLSGGVALGDNEKLEREFIGDYPLTFIFKNISWSCIEEDINPFHVYPNAMHLVE
jgi:tetratricopeptide (TPR) repeat protein